MKVALYDRKGNSFTTYWKEYLKRNKIPFKCVDIYSSDIMCQLEGISYFLWHTDNMNFKDQIFSLQLLNAIESMGIKVFPNFNTNWHFDDKVAQKYLLEAHNLPIVQTYVFYDKQIALQWIDNTEFPKVFKLKRGSGAKAVLLANSKQEARKLVNKAFGKGFKVISPMVLLKDRIKKYKIGKETKVGILKGILRLFIGTPYINSAHREKGYAYFQEFIPNNSFDIRIIVIGNKAFGIKRMNRKDDFRASGSGNIIYDIEQIDIECVKMSFEANLQLKMQCACFDFVFDRNSSPLIVEISYGYNPLGYVECPGYWDSDLYFHQTKIKPEDWMIENLLNENYD